MKDSENTLRGPIMFAATVTTVIALLSLFWMDGSFWSGVTLFALLGFLVSIIIIIQWTAFRMIVRLSERLAKLESKQKSPIADEEVR